MRTKDSSSTPAANSHWLIRLVRWMFGENIQQWMCMLIVIAFAYMIAKGGHGFDLLVFWVAANLWDIFKPNVKVEHE